MDIRSVQKTGDMKYVYLPTKWCKEQKMSANSKVMIDQKSDGSLLIIPQIREKSKTHLNLNIEETDFDTIQKLIVACYINPADSFNINLKKTIDPIKLIESDGLVSLEMVEVDKNQVICESAVAINDPRSLLRTSIRKIKNMIVVIMKNYHEKLIRRYEDEIDRNKLLISKAVIGSLTHSVSSKLKTIELHYIGLISTYVEGMADHLIRIDQKEKKFLESVYNAVDALQKIFEGLDSLEYKKALRFLATIKKIKDNEVKDVHTYRKRRVKKYLVSIGEIILDWAITNEIEE